VAARYPQIPVKFLSTGGQPNYINAKVASLEAMEAVAAHEILVVSDSDVRVTPDYLRAVALPLPNRVWARCAAPIAGSRPPRASLEPDCGRASRPWA